MINPRTQSSDMAFFLKGKKQGNLLLQLPIKFKMILYSAHFMVMQVEVFMMVVFLKFIATSKNFQFLVMMTQNKMPIQNYSML